MFCARKLHETALKHIGRYLLTTRDQGMILNPSIQLNIDAYPDADFAGLYIHEDSLDPVFVRSITGFLITVANCPVIWSSKLQTETALSTMEAEVVAMASCCRELFPVIDLTCELGMAAGIPPNDTAQMHVTPHEDNIGALTLAETLPPQFTPRSKHYAIKTVWFHEQIIKRGIKLLKIDTKDQLGDIFTKSLPEFQFQYL